MYPAYNFASNYELQLSFRDVKDIQHLYGEFSWFHHIHQHYFTAWIDLNAEIYFGYFLHITYYKYCQFSYVTLNTLV